jgi:hypothetical protein
MTLNIKLLSLLFVLLVNTTIGQTTAIPDQNFEQALIDLNIDSDGVINGQVSTADIENIVELDFENISINSYIIDLTGIEDFTALEILNCNYFYINFLDDSQTDIFSNNFNLKELSLKNLCGDCYGSNIDILDLSGLTNIELVDLSNVPINVLKINNPNFDLSNLTLNLSHEGFPGGDWTQHICIEVADPQAANTNQFPYNTWNIIVNDFTTTYGFDDTCTLSVNDFDQLNSISVYPNPVQDILTIDNPGQINIEKIEIYSITGQKLKTFYDIENSIELNELSQGPYFLNVINGRKSKKIKVIKE